MAVYGVFWQKGNHVLLRILKFVFIIICNFIIFRKSLNLSPNRKQQLASYLASVTLALASSLFNCLFSGLDLCVMFLLSPLLFKLIYRQPYDLTLFVSITSIAISFALYFFSVFLTIPLALTLGKAMSYNYAFNIISRIFTGFISILLSHILFRIERFKYGFPFLYKKDFSDISIVLSTGIIFIYTFFRFGQIYSIHLLILVFAFILIISISLYIINRKQLSRFYTSQAANRTIDSLENELNLLQDKISNLEYTNNQLSSIIHKDNKLIPAMEMSVRELLTSYNPQKANQLIEQLKSLSSERNGIVTSYEQNNLSIANFDSIRINSIINYMYKQAIKNNIDFKFTYFGNISRMISDIVSENDFCTLVADLVENAIISTSSVADKYVFLSIEASPNKYTISVFDSGDFFSKEVIKRLGKKRYTTHKDTGGSGIGMMTVFELLKIYNASFSINEKINYAPYTKCVSINFDSIGNKTYNGLPI